MTLNFRRYDTIYEMSRRNIRHSQNFLHDARFVRELVQQADIAGSTVVEIGPGKGIITRELARVATQVIAVELDFHLARALERTLSDFDNVAVVRADFLTWELPTGPYTILSNIPFNMTSDMLHAALDSPHPPVSSYFIVQEKAALRFAGQPFSKLNTQVSILLKAQYAIDIVRTIPRTAFRPMPAVAAALLHFRIKERPEISSSYRQLFRDFVVYGFNQWTPNLLETFRPLFSKGQLSALLLTADLTRLTPSKATFEQWVAVFERFLHSSGGARKLVSGYEARLDAKHVKRVKLHRTR